MFPVPSTHQSYPVSWASFSGCCQYGRSAPRSASPIAAVVLNRRLDSGFRSSSNQRSTGLNSGEYEGNGIGFMPSGQSTSPLRWEGAPSSTSFMSSPGYALRSCAKTPPDKPLSYSAYTGRNFRRWPVRRPHTATAICTCRQRSRAGASRGDTTGGGGRL